MASLLKAYAMLHLPRVVVEGVNEKCLGKLIKCPFEIVVFDKLLRREEMNLDETLNVWCVFINTLPYMDLVLQRNVL